MNAIFQFYWDSHLLHYWFFPILLPLIGYFGTRVLIERGEAGTFKIILIHFCVYLFTIWTTRTASELCQILLLGAVGGAGVDPGDFGITSLSFPLTVLVCSLSAIACLAIYFRSQIARKK